MMQPQHISTAIHEMEARALLEQEYDEYDKGSIDYIMDIYKDVAKHIGFEDKRIDARFIVKFHDILYYTPEEVDNDKDAYARYDDLFEQFCSDQYDYVIDDLKTMDIDVGMMLTHYDVGHYKAFQLYIPNITQDNALDITKEIWENNLGDSYASDYVYVVNALQDLEDNYMTYWIEFLRGSDYPDTYIKEIVDKYNKDYKDKSITIEEK